MNRGSASEVLTAAARTVASMRPRFMNRGSDTGPKRMLDRHQASMRPRFMNRGSAWLRHHTG